MWLYAKAILWEGVPSAMSFYLVTQSLHHPGSPYGQRQLHCFFFAWPVFLFVMIIRFMSPPALHKGKHAVDWGCLWKCPNLSTFQVLHTWWLCSHFTDEKTEAPHLHCCNLCAMLINGLFWYFIGWVKLVKMPQITNQGGSDMHLISYAIVATQTQSHGFGKNGL